MDGTERGELAVLLHNSILREASLCSFWDFSEKYSYFIRVRVRVRVVLRSEIGLII